MIQNRLDRHVCVSFGDTLQLALKFENVLRSATYESVVLLEVGESLLDAANEELVTVLAKHKAHIDELSAQVAHLEELEDVVVEQARKIAELREPIDVDESRTATSHTHRMGGGWGMHISFNGDDVRYRAERHGILRRKREVPYRLIYGHGTEVEVGDFLHTRLGLHRVTEVQREWDPPDMWTGKADLVGEEDATTAGG